MDKALMQRMYEMVGAAKMADAAGRFIDAAKYALYKQIKESKAYTQLDMDWKDFCSEVLMKDLKTVNEEIKLLETYGEYFMTAMGRLRITKKDLLALDRGLSEEDKAKAQEGTIPIGKGFKISEIEDDIDEFLHAINQIKKEAALVKKEQQVLEKELKHHQKKEVELEQKNRDLSKELSALKPPAAAEDRKARFMEQLDLIYDKLADCSGLLNHTMDFSLALQDREMAVKYRAVCKMVIAIAHNLEDKIGEVD